MPTTSDSKRDIIISREIDAMNYIRYIRTLGYEPGSPINHGIIDFAHLIIVRVAWDNEYPAQAHP
jgi:hypothetical protein